MRAATARTATAAALLAALACVSPGLASGARLSLRKPSLARAGGIKGTRWACPTGACDAIRLPSPVKVSAGYALPGTSTILAGSGERKGFDPQDLQSAYRIPSTLEEPQTIAVIEAFGYPHAESDLAAYRSRYGLPACTTANGCFKKVNINGEQANYPEENEEWDVEQALDEEMASAACPQCHIIVVEAPGELPAELAPAVDTAVSLGATEISNSYGYPEKLKEVCGRTDCSQYAKYYEHPGVEIMASSGDSGYDDTYFEISSANFPAGSPSVVAVGGTALYKVPGTSRGWFEEVWNEPALGAGTGSGCSTEPKPSWQQDTGCKFRTENDIAAVAALVTPVSVRLDGAWELVAGTSVASPLTAGIMAHASAKVRALGAEAFYEQPSSLFDVTEGFDWNADNETGASECSAHEYLCNAEPGYDGPTGLGTPDGVPSGVTQTAGAPTVKRVSPRSGPLAGGTTVTITGSRFEDVEEVDFGTVPAASFEVLSATEILARAPASGSSGKVAVTVLTSSGRSASGASAHFTYLK